MTEILTIVALFLVVVLSAVVAGSKREKRAQENVIDELKTRNSVLIDEKTRLINENDTSKNRILAQEAEIKNKNLLINTRNTTIDDLKKKVETLENENSRLIDEYSNYQSMYPTRSA